MRRTTSFSEMHRPGGFVGAVRTAVRYRSHGQLFVPQQPKVSESASTYRRPNPEPRSFRSGRPKQAIKSVNFTICDFGSRFVRGFPKKLGNKLLSFLPALFASFLT
jgi:hypothetical protein